MNRIVIGLVGPISSGKQVLGDFLREHGFWYTSLSDRVREQADLLGWPKERSVLQDIGNSMRTVFGPAVLAQRTLAMIPPEAEFVVVDAIRNPGELAFLRETLGAVIIGVDARREDRLKWYLDRAKRRGEDGLTEEDFNRADARDQGEGEDALGQQGRACMEIADFRVMNDGTDRFLRESLEYLRNELGFEVEGRTKRKEG